MHGLKSYWDDNLIAHLRGLINLHHVPADFVGVISSLMESLCLLSLDPQHILRLLPEVSIIEFHYPVTLPIFKFTIGHELSVLRDGNKQVK